MSDRAFKTICFVLLLMFYPLWANADSIGFEAGYGVRIVAGEDNEFNNAAVTFHKTAGPRSYLEFRGGHLNGGAVMSGSVGLQTKPARFQPFASVGLAWVEVPPPGYLTGTTQIMGTVGLRHWFSDRYALEVSYRHLSNADWADLGTPPNTGIDHILFGLRCRL